MARPKKNRIQLSDADVKKLQGILKNKSTSPTIANRCRILLALDENHPPMQTYDQCMAFFCISRPTIANVARTYSQDGLGTVLKLKRNANSNNSRRKVDGRMEAIRRALKKTGLDLTAVSTGASQAKRTRSL